jgi:hypothetical protein
MRRYTTIEYRNLRRTPACKASLAAWLTDFVAAVERGDYVEDRERDTFMRRLSNEEH